MSPSELLTQTIVNNLIAIREAVLKLPSVRFILFLDKIGILEYIL